MSLIKRFKYFYNNMDGHFRYILKASQYETPVAKILYVLKESINLILGMLAAAIVGWPSSILGRGSKIIGSQVITVGEHSYFKRHAWIEAVFVYNQQLFSPVITIGKRFYVSDSLHISAINKVEIGDDCLFGARVYISDHNHGAYKGSLQSQPEVHPVDRDLVSFGPVIIGSNVWLGDNVVIVGPVKIGNGVVVGANSVVTKDIPDNVMAAGAPLRFKKNYNYDSKQWDTRINQDM